MQTIFRPYSPSEAERSDRSATDRMRHRQKVRQAIRENIADIVAEEAIIGQSRDRIVKVPIRGIREYRFSFGQKQPAVAAGDGNTQPGQVVGKSGDTHPGQGPGAGYQPGIDYYETDITLEELIDIMFEDLELPEMERKRLRHSFAERVSRRKGFRNTCIRVHLDKKRTARQRIRCRQASRKDEDHRFPFHWDDVKYRRMVPKPKLKSNTVVICVMDTSASMDSVKKYLARSFFFMLYQFVRTRYANVEVVFIAHDVQAREVTEQDFFHKGESGGIMISSGYKKTRWTSLPSVTTQRGGISMPSTAPTVTTGARMTSKQSRQPESYARSLSYSVTVKSTRE